MSAIKLINVSKHFKDKIAVDNISFKVPYGKVTALLGSNGAGKSTTLNMISGLLDPTSGSIEICGLSYQSHYKQIKSKLGYLTAEMSLYEALSPRDNLELLANFKNMTSNEYQQRLQELVLRFDMETFLDAPFSSLSSGQKQRALIAAATIHDPEIIIFDEVTASLDILNSKEIMDFVIEQKNKGKAVIFSTHILSEVEYISDNIIIIEKGKIVNRTDYRKLMQDHNAVNITDAFYQELKKGRVA